MNTGGPHTQAHTPINLYMDVVLKLIVEHQQHQQQHKQDMGRNTYIIIPRYPLCGIIAVLSSIAPLSWRVDDDDVSSYAGSVIVCFFIRAQVHGDENENDDDSEWFSWIWR